MPIQNIKVASEGSVNSQKTKEECRALVEALNKVIACYRHLATCVGSSSDCCNLRDELRKTRERAQELAVSNRNKLTAVLRDKSISKEDRSDMECLWVIFSSALELFQTDMCKVFEIGQIFTLSVTDVPVIQTGITGSTTEVTARALSVQNIDCNDRVTNAENLEQKDLEEQIEKVDKMIYDMEMKVNVLWWTVEAKGDVNTELSSNDASSMALLSIEEDENKRCCDRGQFLMSLVFSGVAIVAVVLSISVVYFA
ncbi:regulator of G-protein signaling 9-binding protein B-like [Latimeria chalumnae]|uniref:regulator of G-protein signaling 9-binding protein B-like n=1 Tax=Latimeria chalumnae TaxID=7897 RepID=UPI00313DC6BD